MKTLATRSHRGRRFTEVGMGCAQLGNLSHAISDDEAEQTVQAAWEAGIRVFDTAPHYGLGLSERRLGRALRAYPRDEYIVSTKVGRLLVPSPETAGISDMAHFFDVPADHRRVYDLSRDGILRSIDASLDRLGLDRVDIVYMHDPDEHFEAASTTGAETLTELRDQGVVAAFGAGMNQGAMLADLIDRTDIDIVMCAGRLTLLEQHDARRMLELAAQRDVAVVAAAVYNSGLLSHEHVPDDAHFDYAPASAPVLARARDIERICRDHSATLPSAAMQYPLLFPQVLCVVAGVRGVDQAVQAVERSIRPIPTDLWRALAAAGHIDLPRHTIPEVFHVG
ncbi:aldo/keto reductase [Microbacterium sp. PMB16]|uniref:aldo/keto reductase n=1 Tax=Microbacterium sp. PMB16 TaxID=3120157 RepID=UPI003F4CA00B